MSAIVWWLAHSLVLPFLGIGMRIDLFKSWGHCWVFQICWHNECKTLMASSFRDLNSSPGISSHPLSLLTAVLLKAHFTPQNVWLWETNYSIVVIWFMKIFSIQFFCVFFPSLPDFSIFLVSTIFILYCAHLWAECSLNVSNFPEKISSLSPFVVFFSIIKHCSLKKAFFSLLAVLWISAFNWMYL